MRWVTTADTLLRLLVVAALTLTVECKGAETMATSSVDPAPWPADLDHFVFGGDPFTADDIPRTLSPAMVEAFVRERVDVATPVAPLRQVEKIVAHYDVHEATPFIRPLLVEEEKADDPVIRSAIAARILANSGTPEDRAFAREHYSRLAERVDSLARLREMILLYAELAPEADVDPLRKCIDRRIQTLQGDPERNRLEILELKEEISQRLERARRAAKVRETILALTDRPVRIAELVKIYLNLDYGYLEYLQPWAARQLRREVWAAQPADQRQRTTDAGRREELADTFRGAIAALDRAAQLTPREVIHARVRALRAYAFFGGELSEVERQFLADNGGQQLDALWAD